MEQSFISLHIAVTHPAGSVTPTLQSLGSQTQSHVQIVLVDNASQDITPPWPHGAGPEVMVLRNFRDQGFSRAHNQALSSLFARWPVETWEHRFIGILSSRVLLAPDALQQLVQALEHDPSLMVVSPKIRRATLQITDDSDDPRLIDSGTIEQIGVAFSSALEPVSRGQGQTDEGQYDGSESTPLPGTVCVLIRASALMGAKLGDEWLDNNLPEPYAMADLVWRLHTLQAPMRVIPQALGWIRYAQLGKQSLFKRARYWYGYEALSARSLRRYACILRFKNTSFGQLVLVLPWLIGVWLVSVFTTILDPRSLPALFKSLALIPATWRKRHFLQLAIRRSHARIR